MSDEVCKRCGALPGELCRTPAGYTLAVRHGAKRRQRPNQSSERSLLDKAAAAARKWRGKEKWARKRIKDLEATVRKLEAELAELRSDPGEVKLRVYGNAKWRALGS